MKGATGNFRSSSIFRSFFVILLMLILMVAFFNVIVALSTRSRLLREEMQEQDAYIDSQASFINETFGSLQNIMTYLQQDDAISLRASSHYREAEDYLRNERKIYELLSTFSYTSAPISEILILWEDSPYLYTSSGLVDKEVYFHNRFEGDFAVWESLLQARYDQPTLCTAKGVAKDPEQGLHTITKSSGIYLLQSIRTENQTHPGTFCIVLQADLIQSIFREKRFVEERQIFVLDSERNILASNTERGLDEVLDGLSLDSIHNTSRYLPRKGVISHRETSISGLEYVAFTPYEQVADAFDGIFLMTLLLSALMILLLFGYAFWSSRRMSKPFLRILNALGRSSRSHERVDDVQYITNRIVDLLSVNRTMRTQLESNSEMVLQSVLYKLLMGGPSVEETMASLTSYNLSISTGLYETAVIRMDLARDEEEMFFTQYHDVFEQGLHEYLDSWIIGILQTLPDEYTVVLCLVDQTEQDSLLQEMHSMLEFLRQQIPGTSFFVGVSGPVRSILELRSGYEQSVTALVSRSVQSMDTIIHALPDTDSGTAVPFLPDDLEVQLRLRLEGPDEKALVPYVDMILRQNYEQNIMYKAYLSACLTINRFIQRMVQSKDKNLSENLIPLRSSSCVYTAERCREIVLSNAKAAQKLITQTNASVSISEQIDAYVDAHFHEDINLASVADALGYTANYISRYYKQANGINFTDYLNSRRIAFSCELLSVTSWTLKKIAEMSGFSSSNFFIQVFKKYEGVTPGEYRKSMQAQAKTPDTTS